MQVKKTATSQRSPSVRAGIQTLREQKQHKRQHLLSSSIAPSWFLHRAALVEASESNILLHLE